VAGLTGLRKLHLQNTTITDAGLKELAALKTLRELHLFGKPVTDAGVAALQKELPKCKIMR